MAATVVPPPLIVAVAVPRAPPPLVAVAVAVAMRRAHLRATEGRYSP